MTDPLIQLKQLRIAYQGQTAVNDLSLAINAGQIGCLLGPSGCGKSSILRAIAGFEPPAGGSIHLRGETVADSQRQVAPERRKVAMMFQDFALFPHLHVGDNIAFGLASHRKAQNQQRVAELLALVGLEGHGERAVQSLSGGQQQRVALARAIAAHPDILLLDEPFSSLDVALRESLAKEMRQIIQDQGITALLVTHDQQEAFALADQIGVIRAGELQQWDDAYGLYHRPANPWVAGFIGEGVLLPGTVRAGAVQTPLGPIIAEAESSQDGQAVQVLVRPDDIIHDDHSDYRAQIVARAFRGAHILFTLALPGADNAEVLCLAPSHHNHQPGDDFGIRLDLKHQVVFQRD